MGGVQLHQLVQQVECGGGGGHEERAMVGLGSFGELHVARQALAFVPLAGLGRAPGLVDLGELVGVGVAGQVGHAQQQLGEDAAHRPHVDGGPVLLRGVQQLGRAVPARDDRGREPHLGRRVDARQPEIRQLQLAVGAHEDVIRLQVSVQRPRLVARVQPAQYHLHAALDFGWGDENRAVPYHLVQVGDTILNHHVHVPIRREHVEQPLHHHVASISLENDKRKWETYNHVGMFDFAQQLDFA